MTNILDWIATHRPDVYTSVQYILVEISASLSQIQSRNRRASAHASKISVHTRSILDWASHEPRPCFVLAMEVLDNMAHDVVRHDATTGQPLQGCTAVHPCGDYVCVYEPLKDALAKRYLSVRDSTGYRAPQTPLLKRLVAGLLPVACDMTPPEWIPTHTFAMLEVLQRCFPRHRLVASDFYVLPDAVAGTDGPVVQTRFEGEMVACSTHCVQPGYSSLPPHSSLTHSLHHSLTKHFYKANSPTLLPSTLTHLYAKQN